MPRGLVVLAALFAAIVFSAPADAEDKDNGAIKLFNGKDLSGWKIFVTPKSDVKPESVWSVKDGVIICKGKPRGYLITEKEFSNYKLKVQWRWAPEGNNNDRNSGVFVHVSGEDKIWPKGVEAQLYRDHAGDFWLVDGFKLTVDKERQDKNSPNHYLRLKKSGVFAVWPHPVRPPPMTPARRSMRRAWAGRAARLRPTQTKAASVSASDEDERIRGRCFFMSVLPRARRCALDRSPGAGGRGRR